MRELPEIAPEIRGLLEEIVADPRSSIRLVPRRALGSWFDSDETVRPREVSGTKAERHLIEAHREALAQLLWEASRIAYWKAPALTHRPIEPDGALFDQLRAERSWQLRAERRKAAAEAGSLGVGLLRQCLTSIAASRGLELAQASLSLVPNDHARIFVGVNTPRNQPRSAISLFEKMRTRALAEGLYPQVLRLIAARMCCLERFQEALRTYRLSIEADPSVPYGRFCAFNLSCFLGDDDAAVSEGVDLGLLVKANDMRVLEANQLLRQWAKTRSKSELEVARQVGVRISDRIPQVARLLCGVFAS